MDNKTFTLYMEIMTACKEGRFMFTNGAMNYIVDNCGQKIMINTVLGTKELVPNYNGEARTDMHEANSIETFLNKEDAQNPYVFERQYTVARDMVANAARRNEVLYTNGNLWYIKEAGTVVIVELGTQRYKQGFGYMTTLRSMSLHGAWKYLRFNGENTRREITADDKAFLGIR